MWERPPFPSNEIEALFEEIHSRISHFLRNEVPDEQADRIMAALHQVPRCHFFQQPENQRHALADRPLMEEKRHVSALHIYLQALVRLDIQRGHSFLNVGSGTGWFSTVVGFLLGRPYSNALTVNHGIEIQPENVAWARARTALWADAPNFAPPLFAEGNAYALRVETKYDRIYVGAAARDQPDCLPHLLHCLSPNGGRMLVPVEEHATGSQILYLITRTGDEYKYEFPAPVMFRTLIDCPAGTPAVHFYPLEGVQAILLYFGIGLGCDMPILEALLYAWPRGLTTDGTEVELEGNQTDTEAAP